MLRMVIAIVLSMIHMGVGQLLNRQWAKGIAFILIRHLLPYVLLLLHIQSPLLDILFRLIWLYSVIDAGVVAWKVEKGVIKQEVLRGKKAIFTIGGVLAVLLPLAFAPQITLFLALAMQGPLFNSASDEELEEVRMNAEQYLEERYEQDFDVEEPDYTPQTGTYRMDASPKGNAEGSFLVSKRGETFNDGYVNNVWKNEFSSIINPVMEDTFDNLWSWTMGVSYEEELEDEIDIKDLPSYEYIRESYPNNYHQTIAIYLFHDMTEENKALMYAKAYELIEVIKGENANNTHLTISFHDPELLEKMDPEGRPGQSETRGYQTHKLTVSRTEFNDITSPDDLEEHLRKRGGSE